MVSDLSLSWTLARRDWRAGELRLLLAALVIAVAAIASVGFFVERMKLALAGQAGQLLGADLVLIADTAPDEAIATRAQAAGLSVARTVVFPSMVMAGGRAQLASVKAVTANYPLRGGLRVAPGPNTPDVPAQGVPARGRLWADPSLMQTLGVAVGDTVELGDLSLVVEQAITLEPDRGTGFVNFAPRVLIALDDLEATKLVQPASRVTWRLMFAGAPGKVNAFAQAIRGDLGRGQRIESLESGRPELRATIDRAEKFLALVALLTALIAAVAIALATRRFAERHLDGAAVMRAIGIRERRLARVLVGELLMVGVAGGVLGSALGWGLHLLLVQAIASLLELPLPWPSALPALQATIAGLVLLLGFGAWPFLRLAGVPPLRVLRRDLGAPAAGSWIAIGTAALVFAALLFWFARDVRLAAIALGGFAGGAVVFALAALLTLQALGPLRRLLARGSGNPALRIALAAWSRRRGAAVAQTVALAAGLMALMLLTVTRTDLIDSWRRASPADAPNRFVINIQPDQREPVVAALKASGVQDVDLYPMIRGRLTSINGRAVSPDDYDDDRAKRLVDREFNLSYSDIEPAYNATVDGRWLDPAAAEVSIEQGIGRTLGLKLGDTLDFDIAGETVTAKATGVRKLAWDSMRVNFFMMLSPALLHDRPQTLITAYHRPPGREDDDAALVRQFPNLTVFDTGNIVRQVQAMLEQVVRAVEILFVLTLTAGLVVLYAALASSRDERIREAALMRALGASRGQLVRAQLWELGLAGGIAGLLAAAGALAIGTVLAEQVFQFDYSPRWLGLLAGIAVGALAAIGAGWFGLRGVLSAAPMITLRNV